MDYNKIDILLVVLGIYSVDFCSSSSLPSGTTGNRCIPMEPGVCGKALYNMTVFPNSMGHVSFQEAKEEYLGFAPLLNVNCSDQLERFLCFLYFPVCTVLDFPIPVCRPYCEKAVTPKCRDLLESFNLSPPIFNCEQYPNPTDLCVNVNATVSGNVNNNNYSPPKVYDRDSTYEESMEALEDEINVNLFLLVSNGDKLQLLDISTPNKMDTITLYNRLPDFTSTPIDYYKPQDYIYWASNMDGKIYRGTRKLESLHDIRTIVDTGLGSVESIAVDWHLKVLFWTELLPEAKLRTSSLSGRQVTTILSKGLLNPVSLTLDPLEGKLFWIDRPSSVFTQVASIESYSIVTNRHTTILNISSRNVPHGGRPTTLVADIIGKRLYFIDARSQTIHSLNYDGSDFRLVASRNPYLHEPGNLVVHAGHLIWTDRRYIVWMNKTTGKDILVLKTFDNAAPQNIKIYGSENPSAGKTTYDKKTLDKKWQELSSKENMADKEIYDDDYDDEYDNEWSNTKSNSNKKSSASQCCSRYSSMILFLVTLILFLV